MGHQLPTLTDIEEYEKEKTRAFAEHRIPTLKNPMEVYRESDGSATVYVVEKTDKELAAEEKARDQASQQKSEVEEIIKKAQEDAQKARATETVLPTNVSDPNSPTREESVSLDERNKQRTAEDVVAEINKPAPKSTRK